MIPIIKPSMIYIRIITDSLTIGILLSISISHFLIYLGRRKYNKEKYNFYFSLFVFFLGLYIFFDNTLSSFFVRNSFRLTSAPFTVSSCISLMIYFWIQFISLYIRFPKKVTLYFKTYYVLLLINLFLSISPFFIGFKGYKAVIEIPMMIIYQLSNILTFISIYYFIKKKVYKDTLFMLIFAGTLIILYYLTFHRFYLMSNDMHYNWNNYIFISLFVLAFNYILSIRYNREFKELLELKKNLEEKVKQRTAELKQANEEIEKESSQKSQFLINISHEIKTPLTLVENYLDKHIKEKGASGSLKIVQTNILKLKQDIINIFDVEKVNSHKILYNHSSIVNFSTVLTGRIALFKVTAARRNILLDTNISEDLLVKIDPGALDRLINNLIDNAIKYSEKDSRITVELTKTHNKVIFGVKDRGRGIPESHRKHIFEPYYQISREKSNRQGIGMGLAIVKAIADEIDASIDILGQEFEGTEFRITMAAASVEKGETIIEHTPGGLQVPQAAPGPVKELPQDPGKKTLLVAEDNPQMLHYLFSSLNKHYNVYTAPNGREALLKMSWIDKPDLIISDIMMDEMDGYTFYDRLMEHKERQDIPVLFLTARSDTPEKVKALEKGVIDFISKPFNMAELSAKIETLIKYREKINSTNKTEFKKQLTDFLDRKPPGVNREKLVIDYKLTPKELKIARLLTEGLEYKEIAAELNLSLSSIKKRIHQLYKKLGVQNKVELINFFNRK